MRNLKKDFPILKKKNLIYLDSAATSQKPQQVLDAIQEYYTQYNANVRRGLYPIAEKATEKVEEVRVKTAKFINAKNFLEIIFVRNATEGINLIMQSFASHNIYPGDTIITTITEHHSNFVPWQQLVLQKKANLEVMDFEENFQFSISNYKSQIKKAKIFAIGHVSNVLGTIYPLREIIKEVKKINKNIIVVVDGAQSVPHMKVDVQKMDCDFLVFSGHKMMASTGIGIVYGKKELLEKMPPFLYGSDMIKEVTIEKTIFDEIPGKFEAGTPDIAGIVSLGAAIDYLNAIGMNKVQGHEQKLTKYALKELSKIKGLHILGPTDYKSRSGLVSFTLDGIHPHDVAQILGDRGICVRAGHHCAMPLHKRLSIPASVRVSFYVYNDEVDIDTLVNGIKKVQKVFRMK